MNPYAFIGRNIRLARERQGWTQTQFGERAGGKSRQTISHYEQGGNIDLDTIVSLAKTLGVDVLELLSPGGAAAREKPSRIAALLRELADEVEKAQTT